MRAYRFEPGPIHVVGLTTGDDVVPTNPVDPAGARGFVAAARR